MEQEESLRDKHVSDDGNSAIIREIALIVLYINWTIYFSINEKWHISSWLIPFVFSIINRL